MCVSLWAIRVAYSSKLLDGLYNLYNCKWYNILVDLAIV